MKTTDRSELEHAIAVDERSLAQLRDEGRIDERPLSVYVAYARLALLRHALGDVLGTRAAFVDAARWAVAAYEDNDPSAAVRARTPRELVDAAMIVVAFGTADERRRLASLPRAAWYLPEKPYWDASAVAAAYLLEHLGGGGSADGARGAARSLGAVTGADRGEASWAHQLVTALVAIAERDIDELLRAISGLVKAHELRVDATWHDVPSRFVMLWTMGVETLAAEAGIDVRCMASTMPRAAMDLQLDMAWSGPFHDLASATAAIDAALATMGYARNDAVAGDAFERTLALVEVGGVYWIEADRRIAVALANAAPIETHEIHLANRVGREAHAGSERGGSIAVARARLTERVSGFADTPCAITTLRYVAAPLVGDAALDRIAYGLREADRHAVLVELEPVRVRAERLGGDVHELWVIPSGDDWARIEAVLRRPVNR